MELPLTISNGYGEKIIFLRFSTNDKGQQILEVENEVTPKKGPPMHVHWKQDEGLTVLEGKMGYQFKGGQPEYVDVGGSVVFHAGTPHKFWNAGDTLMRCKGWLSPPNNVMYFLDEIYKSTASNGGRPGTFDSAYLLKRYRSEFYMNEIPGFVQKVIFPISLFFGTLAGKHKKYANAPEPIR